MSDTPHVRHHVRMPDGKHVEVVYRDHRRASEQTRAEPPTQPNRPMGTSGLRDRRRLMRSRAAHRIRCTSASTAPASSSIRSTGPRRAPRHWRIVLRCPECESRREGVFEQAVVERLDDELDRGAGALLSDLRRMTHANMSEEVEFFVRALDADLIVPSDF